MPKIARRDILTITGIAAGAWAVTHLFRQTEALGTDLSGNPTAQALLTDDVAPDMGPAEADLVVAVFTDYRCPVCRATSAALHAAVRQDGRVRLLYRDWPIFGPPSERAARIALAADYQGIYPALHQALMGWPGDIDEAALEAATTSVGGASARLLSDLASHRMDIERTLAATARAALILGLPGTPCYLVGDLLVTGALDPDVYPEAFARGRALAERH